MTTSKSCPTLDPGAGPRKPHPLQLAGRSAQLNCGLSVALPDHLTTNAPPLPSGTWLFHRHRLGCVCIPHLCLPGEGGRQGWFPDAPQPPGAVLALSSPPSARRARTTGIHHPPNTHSSRGVTADPWEAWLGPMAFPSATLPWARESTGTLISTERRQFPVAS